MFTVYRFLFASCLCINKNQKTYENSNKCPENLHTQHVNYLVRWKISCRFFVDGQIISLFRVEARKGVVSVMSIWNWLNVRYTLKTIYIYFWIIQSTMDYSNIFESTRKSNALQNLFNRKWLFLINFTHFYCYNRWSKFWVSLCLHFFLIHDFMIKLMCGFFL